MSTVLNQLKTLGIGLDGMSYVIECDDGSIVVIDGGMYGDAEGLLKYLKKITKKDVPTVDAWFITHNHADHTFCFMAMAEKHASEIRVKKVVVSFATEEFYANCQPETVPEMHRLIADVALFEGAEIVDPSAGDVFTFGSARFDILYTCKDLPIVNGGRGMRTNDTSTVFRLTAEGQTVLFLGDVEAAGNAVLIEKYGKALKSDVVQMAHHGELSSTAEFYRYVDPDIVLWPMGESQYYERLYSMTAAYEANLTLLTKLHVKDVFIAGMGNLRAELPLKPCVAPFRIEPMEESALGVPVRGIVHTDELPDIRNIFDPVWDKADSFEPANRLGKYDGAKALVDLLWNEKALALRVRVTSRNVLTPSDPGAVKANDCCNARLHFSELPVTDMRDRWEHEHFNAFRDLRLYPEIKDGMPQKYNNGDGFVSSYGELRADGFTVCALIPFKGERKRGDVIGLHTEINLNDAPGGARTAQLILAKGPYADLYRALPVGLISFSLD